MSSIEFPDPDEVIRETDERDRKGERDEERERERARREGNDPTVEEEDGTP